MRGTHPPWGVLGYTKDHPPRETGRANLPKGSSRRLGATYGRRFVFLAGLLYELPQTPVCSKLMNTLDHNTAPRPQAP